MSSDTHLQELVAQSRIIIRRSRLTVALAQRTREALERTCEQAYLVLEQCRIEQEDRLSTRKKVPCGHHVPYLELVPTVAGTKS